MPMTYEEIGRRMHLSPERVRQIEHGAIAKLRARLGIDAGYDLQFAPRLRDSKEVHQCQA